MNPLILIVFGSILIAYLIGAIPFAVLIARLRGVEILSVGSRNTGATNVMRCVGPSWGILTLTCDILKGVLAVSIIPALVAHIASAPPPGWLALACGSAAIIGHNWSIYLHFKGGKGVATSAGVLIGITPFAFLCGVIAFALLLGLSRHVSLGSIAAALAVPGAAWIIHAPDDRLTPSVLTVLGMLLIWRHRGNIQRLIKGEENRISFGGRA